MKNIRLLTLATLVLLAGCASQKTLTQSQLNSLDTIAIEPLEISYQKYISPYQKNGKSIPHGSSNYSSSIPTATGGGMIPALIGIAMDSASDNPESHEDYIQNKRFFSDISIQLNNELKSTLEEVATETLKQSDFFSSRIAEESANLFKFEVKEFGFRPDKSEKSAGKKLLFSLNSDVSIHNKRRGKVIFKSFRVFSNTSYSISELKESPDLASSLLQQATQNLRDNAVTFINAKVCIECKDQK